MENFWEQLPTGKNDRPLLFEMGPLEYDFHEIDGLYYMLDRRLSGCLLLMWSKPMNPDVTGTVTLDGKTVPDCTLLPMAAMNDMWVLGVPLRGRVREYDREYRLHVEGFMDTDGNVMNPQDFTVRGIARTEPRQEDATHEAVALQAAREGIVLLENQDSLLPLKTGTTLNLFGRGVHEFRIGAVGAGKINPRYSVNFVEAARTRDDYILNEELIDFYACDRDDIPPENLLDRARRASDTAIVFISRAAGENQDASSAKGEYRLTDGEEALLQKVSAYFAHTVVILNTGYPIDMDFMERYDIHGLIWLGFAGMLAGPALMDILTGAENPSGKLPDTWAMHYADIPAAANFYDCSGRERLGGDAPLFIDTFYEEGLYVGYRYFTTFGVHPAYPFGHGLSYTTFEMKSGTPRIEGDALLLTVDIVNTGDRAGREVSQVYVGKPEDELEQPERELVFFEKTRELAPGKAQRIEAVIPLDCLTSYSEACEAYVLCGGSYRVYVGNDANAPLAGCVKIPETRIVKQVKNRMVCREDLRLLSKRAPKETFPTGQRSGIRAGKTTLWPYQAREHFPARTFDNPTQALTFEAVRKDPGLAGAYASQLTDEELARLCICFSAGWGMEGIGEAGSVASLPGRDLPRFPVSDGNSGVNLNLRNIGMPSGAGLCASFNKALCREVGRVIGEEAKVLGIPLILGPGFNIHRTPLGGRQPEYFSEDPHLAGTMAGCYSQGMESAGTASCYKHLIANNCESARKRNQSVISERAIREIYFKVFEIAMKVHMPASVMTAYNSVNGCPAAADEELIMGLLREENSFDGFVMTDWTTYDSVNVASMLQAGNCWITPGSSDETFTAQVLEALRDGQLSPDRLRENAAYLLRTMARFAR